MFHRLCALLALALLLGAAWLNAPPLPVMGPGPGPEATLVVTPPQPYWCDPSMCDPTPAP